MTTPTPAIADAVALPRSNALRPLASLFVLTLRQHVHGRRLLVLSLLFALPAVLAVVIRLASPRPPSVEELNFGLVLTLIPHTLAPLAALLYASGIVRDEVEEQTLTYLLVRPLPRWALYCTKMAATLLVIWLITAVFVAATVAVIVASCGEPITLSLAVRAATTAVAIGLAQVSYCGLFGLLGLLMRRSLFVGAAYIFLFEGLLASIDTIARRMTIMYYFRVLAMRWLQPAMSKTDWSIDLAAAPEGRTCVLALLGAGLVLTVVAAIIFAGKEFAVKTPEGN